MESKYEKMDSQIFSLNFASMKWSNINFFSNFHFQCMSLFWNVEIISFCCHIVLLILKQSQTSTFFILSPINCSSSNICHHIKTQFNRFKFLSRSWLMISLKIKDSYFHLPTTCLLLSFDLTLSGLALSGSVRLASNYTKIW